MTDPTPSKTAWDAMPESRRRLIEGLAAGHRPFRPAPSVPRQWLVWLGFALVTVGAALSFIGPQFELRERLSDPASAGFLALCFALAAFMAWMGIASSKPDHPFGRGPWILAGVLLVLLFAMPFLFFDRDSLSRVFAENLADGWFCARTVVLVAFPSWVMLGWLASRNAAFRPGWTGAWLGGSAFLLGAGTIQLHCAHWETCHMLVDHLLPMAALIFIPIWVGSRWFSRWRR